MSPIDIKLFQLLLGKVKYFYSGKLYFNHRQLTEAETNPRKSLSCNNTAAPQLEEQKRPGNYHLQ